MRRAPRPPGAAPRWLDAAIDRAHSPLRDRPLQAARASLHDLLPAPTSTELALHRHRWDAPGAAVCPAATCVRLRGSTMASVRTPNAAEAREHRGRYWHDMRGAPAVP